MLKGLVVSSHRWPRKGSRSVGIYLVHDMEQIEKDAARGAICHCPKTKSYQEYIDSDQFSLHIFNDAALKPVCVVSMVNIFRHFGETFHIRTFRDSELIELGILIGEKVKHLGPLSVDVHRRDNGEYVVLEFNPRISGCYSLSHYAGADFPGKIFDIVLGQQSRVSAIDAFEDDVIMLKQYVTAKVYQREIDEYVCRSR